MNTHRLAPLSIQPVNSDVFAVRGANGLHVGYLKRIGTVWKFKAVGYTASGQPEPGGGPLTDGHNTTLEQPDAAVLSERLCPR